MYYCSLQKVKQIINIGKEGMLHGRFPKLPYIIPKDWWQWNIFPYEMPYLILREDKSNLVMTIYVNIQCKKSILFWKSKHIFKAMDDG